MPKSALPDHLKDKRHDDYPWPFKWIPRAWTSYKLVGPPVLLWGNQGNFVPTLPFRGPYVGMFATPSVYTSFEDAERFPTLAPGPIPDPVKSKKALVWGLYGVKLAFWMPVLPLGLAFTLKRGKTRYHTRIGARWDDVDLYYTIPTFTFDIDRNKYPEL